MLRKVTVGRRRWLKKMMVEVFGMLRRIGI
jgi:hypothetical protein